jgi:hypothetical protein
MGARDRSNREQPRYNAERAVRDIAIAAMNTKGSTSVAAMAMVIAVLPSLGRIGLVLLAAGALWPQPSVPPAADVTTSSEKRLSPPIPNEAQQ